MSPNRRQTRGVLWDVIAPWVRWPLYSPRRLVSVLAGLVILLVLWHIASAPARTTESTATPAASTATPASSTATSAPSATQSTALASPSPMLTSPGLQGAMSSSPSGMTAGSTAGPTGPTGPAVPAGAAETARGFVTAWARPSLPAEQWLAGVRGYLAPELERSMTYTDPSQIDATTVTGAARMVRVLPDGTAASFEVPTDAGTTLVELALVQGRWLATDIVPASAAGPGD